jgi:hypothetical protein
MSTFQIQGLADGQWGWESVADSATAATYSTEDAAIEAARELIDTCGWGENEVRVVAAAGGRE